MKASPPSLEPAKSPPRSRRRQPAANSAADSPVSKKSPRSTRTLKKPAGLEADDIEKRTASDSSGKRIATEAVSTEQLPPPLPEGAAAKKTRQTTKAKQERGESQDQEPPARETLAKPKRKHNVEEQQEPANPQTDGDTPKTVKRNKFVKVEEAEIEIGKPSPKNAKLKKTTETEVDETVKEEASPKKAKRKTKVKEEDEEIQEGEGGQKKITRRRKTKEEKELEAMPLAVRTGGLRMFIGAHVSGAKGWSLSMYVASVRLRLCSESRGTKFSHQLRAYWVNNSLCTLKTW